MVVCTNKVVLNVAMTTLDPNWKHRGSDGKEMEISKGVWNDRDSSIGWMQ